MALTKAQEYASPALRIKYLPADELEALDTRLWQRDVAKGCIDPELLGTARDWAEVVIESVGRTLRLPIFMAHLANPLGLLEPELDDARLGSLWDDGTWSGTLVWDSAVHACELLLDDAEWRARLRGASVLELGCGLGLPGLVCHALGAAPVLLTDRADVAALVADGLAANAIAPDAVRALEFAWSDAAARRLLADELGERAPDVVITCDCIFAPLFGESYLLQQMLRALAAPHTVVLVALERRVGDGAEDFFSQAAAAGFEASLRARHARVLVCEMRRREGSVSC